MDRTSRFRRSRTRLVRRLGIMVGSRWTWCVSRPKIDSEILVIQHDPTPARIHVIQLTLTTPRDTLSASSPELELDPVPTLTHTPPRRTMSARKRSENSVGSNCQSSNAGFSSNVRSSVGMYCVEPGDGSIADISRGSFVVLSASVEGISSYLKTKGVKDRENGGSSFQIPVNNGGIRWWRSRNHESRWYILLYSSSTVSQHRSPECC